MVSPRPRYLGKNLPIPKVPRKPKVIVPVPSDATILSKIEQGGRLAQGFGLIGETQVFSRPSVYFSSLMVRHEINKDFIRPLLSFLSVKGEHAPTDKYARLRDTLREEIAKRRAHEIAEKQNNNGEPRLLRNKQEVAFMLGLFCLDAAAATELNSDTPEAQGLGFRHILSITDPQLRPTVFASAVYAAAQLLPRPEPPQDVRRARPRRT